MSRQPVLDDWQVDPWDDPVELYDFEAEPPRRGGGPVKWVVYGAFVVALVLVLVAGATGMWVLRQVNPPGEAAEAINFTVNADDTVETVGVRLQAAGVITSTRVWDWYVDQKGGLTLTPGYYTVKPRDTMGNILGVLRTPPAQTYDKVTFPEGFTLEQIGARLENRIPRLTATEFSSAATSLRVVSKYGPPGGTSNMEGLLFPDTYQIAGNESEEQVLQRMVTLMERIGAREGLDEAGARLGYSPYQILTIASMIEREAKVPEDRPLIARVIYNRLFFGMPLQIDATLYYGQDPERPFSELKAIDSPYNTYLYGGLPPTPIAMPGRAAIRAAMNPAPNPDAKDCPGGKPCAWLYYVLADEEGRHAFATNLDDHERNVAEARRQGLLG